MSDGASATSNLPANPYLVPVAGNPASINPYKSAPTSTLSSSASRPSPALRHSTPPPQPAVTVRALAFLSPLFFLPLFYPSLPRWLLLPIVSHRLLLLLSDITSRSISNSVSSNTSRATIISRAFRRRRILRNPIITIRWADRNREDTISRLLRKAIISLKWFSSNNNYTRLSRSNNNNVARRTRQLATGPLITMTLRWAKSWVVVPLELSLRDDGA